MDNSKQWQSKMKFELPHFKGDYRIDKVFDWVKPQLFPSKVPPSYVRHLSSAIPQVTRIIQNVGESS